ncbi:hypothetical protein POSPLADRAFT_1052368 [Postia placenta MAD-698-R-SB12]|uniref:F-box domain-containing protein n=1 Tax=Postia placenta MAD-698-R-SB12 TaxID=670580 RepID=A0A1X6NAM9_9APHY|nr:hypothetical protein POSPLADRAFT_1052368 [Postia placenta MAD-698-R-SB12]OSX65699.1 hypothetical protein POSPLADRAFT_1052368 [Postia placenta MAD-698-R-SB12]
MLRRLPLEVWLLVIDALGAEGEYDALEAFAEASEGLLKERSERYIPEKMTFRTKEGVASINLRQRWAGPKKVRILGENRSGKIPHLATFASRLAGKWTNMEQLEIKRAEWPVHDFDLRSLLLDLACFDIEYLVLWDVTFPTVLTFWRLVCTFPRCIFLRDVRFAKTAIDARTLSALRLSSASKLFLVVLPEQSDMDRRRSLATHTAGLLEMILAQTQASPSPWSNITALTLIDVILPTAATFGRLLCAFPALKRLKIVRHFMFSEHGFNLSDVPMLSKLTKIELDEDFSLWSDPQSVHDLVDLLIQSGASRRLEGIDVWLSPSSRGGTSIDIALNRLVTHAVQSLKYLRLNELVQDKLPLFNEASTYAAPSTACCFNISANTHLKHLVVQVEITHEGGSPLALLLQLLHQVTLAHISNIDLLFIFTDKADLAKLWADLRHLDAALSKTSFKTLREVEMVFCPENEFTDLPEALVESCLPKLDARRILRIRVDRPSDEDEDEEDEFYKFLARAGRGERPLSLNSNSTTFMHYPTHTS